MWATLVRDRKVDSLPARHNVGVTAPVTTASTEPVDLSEAAEAWPGRPYPLGATWTSECTNFAVFAPDATGVVVCLLDEQGFEERHRLTERSLGIWHGEVAGVSVGRRYGFRVEGPWEPSTGRVFNPAKLLIDPYARAVTGDLAPDGATYGYRRPWRDPGPDFTGFPEPDPRDSAPLVPHGVVVHDEFDWRGDRPPGTSWQDTVIYEMHVKGFSATNPAVPEALRGTYAGLGHPASTAYLRELGVTAVELLPVHQFATEPVLARNGRSNYWGYNTLAFFAPHHGYSSSGSRGEQVTEFKEMVRSLHAAGIEVLLDVVYNHTAEGGASGPTLSLRGFDDRGYYKRVGLPHDPRYLDLTGCGNTVDASYPPALRMILDSLRYWVTEMHVDGFRFDLTSALSRTGPHVDLRGDFLVAISQDPVLRHVKLVAEPWDITSEGYLVGRYPPPWVEWNDQYRDTVRDFWRNRSGGIRTVATRLAGSSDLYADDGRSPYASVNFITAHDGFTLRDLVSYERKHNEANGEDNRDGAGENRAWNCGVEGETDDPAILTLRRRQAANLMLTLCLSAGVPMLSMGDERGRTQGGNNNAYNQDNEISWLDWTDDSWADDSWSALHTLTREALRLRREHPALRQRHYLEGRPTVPGGPLDLAWMHPSGRVMTVDDWHDDTLVTFAMFVSGTPLRGRGPRGEVLHDNSFLVWFNAHPEEQVVHLPHNAWFDQGEVVLSTDPAHRTGDPVAAGEELRLMGRSLVVLRDL